MDQSKHDSHVSSIRHRPPHLMQPTINEFATLTGRPRSSRRPSFGITPRLLEYHELLAWQQDNQYLLTGYRRASFDYAECFQSLFYWHNESINIHSHLLGAFLFIFMAPAIYSAERLISTIPVADLLIISIFFLSAISCLTLSSCFHLVSCHSASVARKANQLDYAGIIVLIVGSFVPSIYYGFYCDPSLQRRYWTMICTLGLGCTIVTVHPRFRSPAWRPTRVTMFVAMGLSALFPIMHGSWIYGVEALVRSVGLYWLVLEGVLYILGASIYAIRIPEKLAPMSFDLVGSSHQVFHLLIILAACSHLVALMQAFHYAQRHQCPQSD